MKLHPKAGGYFILATVAITICAMIYLIGDLLIGKFTFQDYAEENDCKILEVNTSLSIRPIYKCKNGELIAR